MIVLQKMDSCSGLGDVKIRMEGRQFKKKDPIEMRIFVEMDNQKNIRSNVSIYRSRSTESLKYNLWSQALEF